MAPVIPLAAEPHRATCGQVRWHFQQRAILRSSIPNQFANICAYGYLTAKGLQQRQNWQVWRIGLAYRLTIRRV